MRLDQGVATTYDEVARSLGVEYPQPIAAALETWECWKRVRGSRHIAFGGLAGPDWVEISVRLGLTGQWREDIVEGLELCFEVQAEIEAAQRPRRER